MRKLLNRILSCTLLLALFSCGSAPEVKIGSKKFTESVTLAEIAAQLAGKVDPHVKHLRALGGTRVLWDALVKGDVDLYPEYTGTITEEIFAGRHLQGDREIREALVKYNIVMSNSLGFSDNYALGMKKSLAESLHITAISDLKKYPDLKFGFSNEFMDRADGWPGLKNAYQLPQKNVEGLEHELAYRALASGAIAVTDLYSTDANIRYYHLITLKDDKHFFPEYKAVFLYRAQLEKTAPKALKEMLKLQGMIPETTMVRLNKLVKIDGMSENQVASDFIRKHFGTRTDFEQMTFFQRLFLRTKQHLFLVAISLFAAILISIPLGIMAFLWPKSGQFILGFVGVIQTIPSLALIVFMIPLLGIGNEPAIVALFLYSLLPIVRNTHSGLNDIARAIRESAEALGLSAPARLRLVELPLASRSILAGIKTSAVINIGTATLGALIGAGGYGQPILTGIRLNDVGLILEGAVPAAALALLVQGLFELLEIYFVPKGLRIKSEIANG
ncbi:MAG: glycine betaine ABC transporter substrate-binding protein [Calditrichia bacterium]